MGVEWQRAWVTLAAQDFDRSVEFYQRFLAQSPMSVIPDIYAEFELGGLRLGIYRPRSEEVTQFVEPPSPDRAKYETKHQTQDQTEWPHQMTFPPLSLCLEVTDLAIAITHLTQLGYPPSGEIIVAPHGQEIFAYDPDGNRLILYQRSRHPN